MVNDMKRFIKWGLLFIIIISSFLLYSRFISTKGLIVKEYKITDSNLPDYFHGFKIVHISDIHYGRTVKDKELENMVNEINKLKPDIVVLTGDLIDRDTKLTPTNVNNISNILKGIDVNISKYAITGNHDSKFDNWEAIITSAGFTNLNDTYDLVYNNGLSPLFIGGISQNTDSVLSIEDKFKPINEYLNSKNNEDKNQEIKDENNTDKVQEDKNITTAYNILLVHEPDFIDRIDYSKFNLILGGHSHNGQVRFPFIGAVILPPNAKKYYKEYYDLNNTDFYISSGVGTSNISFRWFNKPSINFYRLTKY